MNTTDPISDYLTRIRNAILAKHDRVDVPLSKLKLELSGILRDEGYIRDFDVVEEQPVGKIRLFLRYTPDGTPAITRIARVSKPGRRVYKKAVEIGPVLNGIGLGIISTSRGILTFDQAKREGVGGEVLCELW
ncbi:MAG TPA: 30S ribosomal protein S8 [Thermoanaerobaculia bacterium]|nr:30S ribosomal protein S8 [Thermoanaerobaculia bacterium]